MPYLKGDNQEATAIHELYQSNNDQKAFLATARQFLSRERSGNGGSSSTPRETAQPRSQSTSSAPPIPTTAATSTTHGNTANPPPTVSSNGHNSINGNGTLPQVLLSHSNADASQQSNQSQLQEGETSPGMQVLERKMAGLLSDDDDVYPMPVNLPSIGGTTIGPSSPDAVNPSNGSTFESLFPSNNNPIQRQSLPPGMLPQQTHQQPQQQFSHQQHPPIPQQNPFLQQPSHSSNGRSHSMGIPATPSSQSSDYSRSRFTGLFEGGNNQRNGLTSSLFQQPGPGAPMPNNPGSPWSSPMPPSQAPPPPGLPGPSQHVQSLGSSISSISPMNTPSKSSTPAPETP